MKRLVALVAGWLALGSAAAHAQDTPQADHRGCEPATFEDSTFTVCTYDPALDSLRLAWRGAEGPIDSLPALKDFLGPDAGAVRFAMNAGMYEPDQSPVGAYVEDGHALRQPNLRDGEGNFYLKPNGVFWVDDRGAPHIDETAAFAAASPPARWATQSGPLLLAHGVLHPAVAPNGTSQTTRNAVGICGARAQFVISEAPVSFGRLARFLRDQLGCTDALYLDGHIASLWAPGLGHMDARTGLGTFVVVSRATP
jgi:uncharacterized protein YigE (DUF2233 family)